MLTLLASAPWMVMSMTAAMDNPVAASVTYCHYTPAFTPAALRMGDECFIPAKLAGRIGWACTVRGDNASVIVDGRRVDTFVRRIGTDPYIALRTVAASIGAVTEWGSDTNLRVFSKLYKISAIGRGLEVRGTLPVKSNIFAVKSPHRVVVDVMGARIDKASLPTTEGNVRYSQFNDNTVRVVVQVDAPPILTASAMPAKLLTSVAWKGGSSVSLDALPSGQAVKPVVSSIAKPAVGLPSPTVSVGVLILAKDTVKESLITILVSGVAPQQLSAKRDDAGVYWVGLPNARVASAAMGEISGVSIRSASFVERPGGGVNLRMELKRPMGVKVSSTTDNISIRIVEPKSAGGTLASKTIVVDAGHGGSDGGAKFGGLREKDFTLAIAKMVAEELTENGTTVVVTRDDDRFIGLNERPKVANRSDADFFISIHINSNTRSNSQSGTFTYYHRDNADCKLLAECIQAEIAKVSGLPNRGIRSDRKEAPANGFAVLRGSQMPAVLVEVAYINNATDRGLLQTWEFKKRVADAIVRGMRTYIGEQQED
ncbi:MAG: N-acetylmuramoyl-L-alanine amidase [Armatimonadetes bacterium]|nr:N-acetylmuramoyl-L-alanine amidase [Armatimonadota bacterium]